MESGDGDGPHPKLPFLPAPHPPLLPRAPSAHPPPPMPRWPVPPGPSGGLAVLRALPPTPCGGNTFLIVSLPFMGCQGARAAAPRPFPLLTVFILISSPAPPPQEPPPSCPTDAPQMGARQAAWAQPLPAPGFLQPPPATGAFGEGSFQRVLAVLTP